MDSSSAVVSLDESDLAKALLAHFAYNMLFVVSDTESVGDTLSVTIDDVESTLFVGMAETSITGPRLVVLCEMGGAERLVAVEAGTDVQWVVRQMYYTVRSDEDVYISNFS